MRLIRGLRNLPAGRRACVAALGGFDGLHVGHRAVLERALELARRRRLASAVVLFEPLPHEFFGDRPGRIYGLRQRLEILREFGVEQALCLRFDAAFAALAAEDFVRKALVDGLKARVLAVGRDFRFGAGRRGDHDMLARLGATHGYTVEAVDEVRVGGRRASSTRVREALRDGAFDTAERLLGRPFEVRARVVRGAGRGAQLGFPTANLQVGRFPPPLRGVLSAEVTGVAAGRALPGVVNAGVRPTFGGEQYCLEVHIPGFNGALYNRRLCVRPRALLRGERRFASVASLKKQIGKDVEAAMRAAAS